MQHHIDPTLPISLYGLIGRPVGHSLSPVLHNFIFSNLKMNAVYTAWEIAPEHLPGFVTAMRTLPIMGASVTIPHKQGIMPLIDRIMLRAAKAGAVNTLFWSGDEIHGDNTDIAGFIAPLAGRHQQFRKALVVGAGGAARAVLAGLGEIFDGEIYLCGRNEQKAGELAAATGAMLVPWAARGEAGADMVINTTPLGMFGAHQAETPFPARGFAKPGGLAYDLIYNPACTVFMAEAKAAGWDVLGGMDMFMAQGLEQIRLWTGQKVINPPTADIFSNHRSFK